MFPNQNNSTQPNLNKTNARAYLRFFQHHPDGSIGDGGVDDFRFITLFPRAVQPYLAPVANFCYGFCLLCGLCKDREVGLFYLVLVNCCVAAAT